MAEGISIPVLGLGMWRVPEGDVAERAVRWALEAGYRHIDTAQGYGNEASVGRGLRASGVPRDDVFVTTKFSPANSDPVAALEDSLRRLGLDRVDLYLVHWPQDGPLAAWPGMERAFEQNLTRSIGVSNFDASELARVLASAGTPPAINQIQLSPFQHRRRLIEACRRNGVLVEAYSPLTSGEDLAHPAIAEVAGSSGRTPAQVMLRWGIQRGFVVIPKSVRRERIVENAAALDFELSPREMERLDGLDRTRGTDRALENDWWTWTWRDSARARLGRLRDRLG
jgi:2,5-diketo-D-gluconate reductase A